MEQHLRQYFKAEKEGAIIFMMAGFSAIVGSILFWTFFPHIIVKGIAVSAGLIALVQLGVGASVYFKTNKQVNQLLTQFKSKPSEFYKSETHRMEAVMSSFKTIRKVEMGIFVLGIVLALAGSVGELGWFMTGTGVGLCVQSAVSLLLDLSAEWRSGMYLHHLKKRQ